MEKEVFERLLKEFSEVNERASKLKDFILDEEKIKKVDNEVNNIFFLLSFSCLQAVLCSPIRLSKVLLQD